MNNTFSLPFRQIWCVDFEFIANAGSKQNPICLVAKEIRSGQTIRVWEDELKSLKLAPYPCGADSLFVAYYASAEFGCHLSLGWPLPVNVLDLFTEFRTMTNGKTTPSGSGLLGAQIYFGLESISTEDKDSMRNLVMDGGPWNSNEVQAILDYCESDVLALEKLLPKMESGIDLSRALLRGRYMKAMASIEFNGIPIDTDALDIFRNNWSDIQGQLIEKINADYGVYEGKTFKLNMFADWLVERNIPWPRLDSGRLDLSDDTFKDMSRSFPEVSPLRELRIALSQMRLSELAVGEDGRNRCMLSAFRAKTGRNQPSNAKFIFGPAVWLRGLARPKPHYGLAYIDWSQQEFGIAAALSKDPLMMKAYQSGDPYLAFAKQAGAVPDDATKQSHKNEREQFKACVLAVQYGMGAESLAARINQSTAHARELLRLHRSTYKVFWGWSDGVLNYAMLKGKVWTVFGWNIYVGDKPNSRSLQNFPMQANGAEMLRLACCFVVEQGIHVCAPVHDAILIGAPLDDLDQHVIQTQELMAKASEIVLDGFSLRSDAYVIRYPDRYMDDRGTKMWETVWNCLEELEENQGVRL
jgi:hypothetical protein